MPIPAAVTSGSTSDTSTANALRTVARSRSSAQSRSYRGTGVHDVVPSTRGASVVTGVGSGVEAGVGVDGALHAASATTIAATAVRAPSRDEGLCMA